MGKGADTHERIVRRAMALASRDGLGGVSIGGLATELKLSKSGLFAHFESKEHLQLSLLQRAADDFTAQVLQPALRQPRGEERLRDFFERWVRWGQDSRLPGGCLLMNASVELDDKPGPLRDLLEAHQRALIDSVASIVKGATEERQFREVDARQFAHDLYALVIGYSQLTRLLRERNGMARAHSAFERMVRWARR
jgi:AcrR family transcriptional regulator